MSMFEDMAKKMVQTFAGLDDIVLLREIAGNGIEQATDAGRSVVGAALVGGGLAARTATMRRSWRCWWMPGCRPWTPCAPARAMVRT